MRDYKLIVNEKWRDFEMLAFIAIKSELKDYNVIKETLTEAIKDGGYETDILKHGFFFVNRYGNPLSEQSARRMLHKYTKLLWKDICITPHMFRHSFATYLMEEDVNIRYIQKLLGHSSITTTQIYTYVAMEKEREILRTKHPRNQMQFCIEHNT